MSYFRALTWSLLLFAAAAFMHGNAHAQSVSYPATQTNTSQCTTAPCYQYNVNGNQWEPTQLLACQTVVSAPYTAVVGAANGTYPYGTCLQEQNGELYGTFGYGRESAAPVAPVYSCGTGGGTLSGSSCGCPSGDVLGSDGASCVVPDACASAATTVLTGVYIPTTAIGIQPSSTCNAGCSATVIDTSKAMSGCSASGTCLFGPVTAMVVDSPCTASSAPASSSGASTVAPDPTPPPAGMCPGTVNGVAVNEPCTSSQTSTGSGATPSTGASADGPATTASSPAGTTPGTSTSGSVTTCASGQCTTTTTKATNNADGTTTTQSSSSSQPQAQYCQQNPTSPQCAATQDAYSSNCNQGAAVPVCTGDPIACATANALAQQNCASTYEDAATQATVQSLTSVTGTAPSAGDTTINLAGMGPVAEAASCPVADTTFTVGPMTLSFPIGTVLCPKLAMIHAAVMAFGSFVWVLIVMGIKM